MITLVLQQSCHRTRHTYRKLVQVLKHTDSNNEWMLTAACSIKSHHIQIQYSSNGIITQPTIEWRTLPFSKPWVCQWGKTWFCRAVEDWRISSWLAWYPSPFSFHCTLTSNTLRIAINIHWLTTLFFIFQTVTFFKSTSCL